MDIHLIFMYLGIMDIHLIFMYLGFMDIHLIFLCVACYRTANVNMCT